MKALSIMFAGFVGLADYVVEVMIMKSGGMAILLVSGLRHL